MANGGNKEILNRTLDLFESGTVHNLKVDKDKKTITLVHLENDGNGSPIYAEEGYWLSEVVDLGDIFTDFENANVSFKNDNTSKLKIFTRSSENNFLWSDWVEISSTNMINSPTRRYIQFKIVFYSGFIRDKFVISTFDKEEDVELFDNNHLLTVNDGVLKVRNSFEYDMELSPSLSEEYDYYRFKIERSNWTKINYISTGGK